MNRVLHTFDDDDFSVEPRFESLTSSRLLPGVVVIYIAISNKTEAPKS